MFMIVNNYSITKTSIYACKKPYIDYLMTNIRAALDKND
jgi:hypothetical protein